MPVPPFDSEGIEAKMREAERRLLAQMAEDMYRGMVWPLRSLPPPSQWEMFWTRVGWRWFDLRCWIAKHILRVLPRDDDWWS